MERASRLLRSLPLPADSISAEELAARAWPLAVGRKVAAHTRPVRMVRTRLVVEVEDKIWQRQLFTLTKQILANLEKTLGRGLVEDIEFRVVPRKREPQRAVGQPRPRSSRRGRRESPTRCCAPSTKHRGRKHWREDHRRGSPLRGRLGQPAS